MIIKFVKHLRLLVILCPALKINQTPRFHFLHSNCMIPSLAHWRNHSQQTHLKGISCLFFLIFACLPHSRECICLSFIHSVSQRCVKSTECLSCAFTLFFYVDVLELRACLCSLLYLLCLLVILTVLLVNHVFTNMGQPMCRWLHWEYHVT